MGTLLNSPNPLTLFGTGGGRHHGAVPGMTLAIESEARLALPVISDPRRAVIAAPIIFWIAGVSPARPKLRRWTFQPHAAAVSPSCCLGIREIRHYPLYTLADLSGKFDRSHFVTAGEHPVNTAGNEVATHREANLERELKWTGVANILRGCWAATRLISVSRTV